MAHSPEFLTERIKIAEEDSLLRSLKKRNGVDFASNDYLGFANDPWLKESFWHGVKDSPLGSTGSRLLRGNLDIFEAAENHLAAFVGREAALILPSGYQANLALLSCILRPDDLVFSDALNHASIIDGIRLGRAGKVIYPHCDLEALRRLLERDTTQGQRFIVTESLFSMEGDSAPLNGLTNLAEEFDSHLIVDEAHATGLFGENGGGLVQHHQLQNRVFASIHTGGKALGVGGAWIAGDSKLKEYLINFSRPWIFSTAPLPSLALLLRLSVERWKQVGTHRVQRVFKNSAHLRKSLDLALDFPVSPIVPFYIGDNERALSISAKIQELGYDVRAIRPPTVPQGTARLRLTVNSMHTEEEIQGLSRALLDGGKHS